MLLEYILILFLNLLQSRFLHAVKCSPGYHGPLCNMACRYPNYGKECQLQCLCEEEQCNPITGCVRKKCSTGYHGPLCNMTCRYPNYGDDCQGECLCEEESCNHVTGCLQTNESDWTQRLPLNITELKIKYVSVENVTLGTGPLHIGSMWSKMNMTHRAMFISTCIIGVIVFVLMLIVFLYFIHKRKDAVVRYYQRRKWKTYNKYHFMNFDS